MKYSLKTYIQNGFKSCDIFGQYIRLYIRGESQYKSTIGGICTAGLFVLGIYFAIYFALDMIQKRNPNIIVYSTLINNEVKLDNTNFFFAYQVTYFNNTPLDLSDGMFLVDFNVLSSQYFLDRNNITKIPKIKCDKNFFKGIAVTKVAMDEILANFTCPLLNTSLSGDPFHSLDQTTIWLEFYVNQTALLNAFKNNLALLYSSGAFPLRLKLYYQSFAFDPDNYSNPLEKEIAFTEIKMTFENYLFVATGFAKARLIRDDSFLLRSYNESSMIGFKFFNSISFQSLPANGIRKLFAANIFIHVYEEIYKRSYQKLQDVGAQTSAMIRMMMMALDLILLAYTFNRINEQLAFKFFRYEHENTENAKELFKRRKTIMEKELKIQLPKRKAKEFTNLMSMELNNTVSHFGKARLQKEKSLVTKLKELEFGEGIEKKKKTYYDDSEFNIPSERRLFQSRFVDGVSDSEAKKYNISEEGISSNDLTFNNKGYNDAEDILRKKGNSMKVIESSLKQNLEKGPPVIKMSKVSAYKINKMFNLDEILKKSDKMSFRDSIRMYIFCCPISDKLKEKKKFYQKAEEKIKEKLDIVSILSKLEEFDNMKILFLNNHQNLSLKYCKKANILNTNFSNMIDFNEIFQGADKRQNIITLIHYFVNKIREKNADQIDKKLLEMIQPEILSTIFDLIE